MEESKDDGVVRKDERVDKRRHRFKKKYDHIKSSTR
jgi:hypothetical protein